MQKYCFLLIVSLHLSIVANAQTSLDEVCSYAPQYCERAKAHDTEKSVKKRENLYRMAYFLRQDIRKAAEMFNIPEEAIAGAFIAENTMNVSVDDRVQEILVRANITKGGKAGSVGLGQMNSRPLKIAGEILAKKEQTNLNYRQMYDDYSNPFRGVYYIAAYMRYSADTYQEIAGVQIQDNPGALTTLYNLGKVKEKARALKKKEISERKPRVNYFGWFVEHYQDEIKKVVGQKKDISSRKITMNQEVEYHPKQAYMNYSFTLPCDSDKKAEKRKISKYNKEFLYFLPEYTRQMHTSRPKLTDQQSKMYKIGTVKNCDDIDYTIVSDGTNEFYIKSSEWRTIGAARTGFIQEVKDIEECSKKAKRCEELIKKTFPESLSEILENGQMTFKYRKRNNLATYLDHTNYEPSCELKKEKTNETTYMPKNEFIQLWDSLETTCRERFQWADYVITSRFADLHQLFSSQIDEQSKISSEAYNEMLKLKNHCAENKVSPCDKKEKRYTCSPRTKRQMIMSGAELGLKKLCGIDVIYTDQKLKRHIKKLTKALKIKNKCSFSVIKNLGFIKDLDQTNCFSQFKITNKYLSYALKSSQINFFEDVENESVDSFIAIPINKCTEVSVINLDDFIPLDQILSDNESP